jgi:hypothetical protein
MIEFDELINELDSKDCSESLYVKFIPFGEKGFEKLLSLVKEGMLTPLQVCNAVKVLGGLVIQACQDKKVDLLELVQWLCDSSDLDIRSLAACVMVGLVRSSEEYPNLYHIGVNTRSDIYPYVEKVLRSGVDSNAQEYLKKFIDGDL